MNKKEQIFNNNIMELNNCIMDIIKEKNYEANVSIGACNLCIMNLLAIVYSIDKNYASQLKSTIIDSMDNLENDMDIYLS